jgi:hypothetical protein
MLSTTCTQNPQPENDLNQGFDYELATIIAPPLRHITPALVTTTSAFSAEHMASAKEQDSSQTFSNPEFSRLSSLFPWLLHRAIRQESSKAGVSVTFPPSGDCVLRLAILPNKVQHWAMQLFEEHVDTEGSLRFLLSEKGRRRIPKPTLEITGVEPDSIQRSFLFLIATGIENCSIRRHEAESGYLMLTECVKMEISNDSAECAYLEVHIGTDAGIAVYNHLFLN